MHQLLTDPLFYWTARDGSPGSSSLPSLLERLTDPDPPALVGFDDLQAHQQHAWHAFLVQTAAMICQRRDLDPRGIVEADRWREGLLDLSEGQDSAWELIVDDLTQPAFMQAPLISQLGDLKNVAEAADTIDLPVAAKDMDTKHSRAVTSDPAPWIFALITLQTCQGYSGRGNYGIARMNGGLGNRPVIAGAPDLSISNRWRRDLDQVLAAEATEPSPWGAGKTALLWLQPWSGAEAVDMVACDPLVIEICRRIRFVDENGAIVARFGASKVARLSGAEELAGDVDDPWTPIDASSNKALTLGGGGFSYKKVTDLISGGYRQAVCSDLEADDRWWLGQALVRGQGKTDGFHQRLIPLQKRIVSFFKKPDQRERLASIASTMIEDAKHLRLSLLKPALCALFQPERPGERVRLEDAHADRLVDEADRRIDQRFFPHLWDQLADDETRADWQQHLVDIGRDILDRAIEEMPTQATFRHRAISRAEALFNSGINKRFKDLTARTSSQATPTGAPQQ